MALPDETAPRAGDLTVPVGDFGVDSALRADPGVPGRFVGEISEAWKVVFAFGGMSMAVALRATQDALARDDLDLVSANAVFCAPIRCAEVVVDTTVLRSGRSAGQVTADLRNVGDDGVGVHLVATYGHRVDHQVDFVDLTFPEVPDADDCEPPGPRADDDPFPDINFHQQCDWRPATHEVWPDDWTPGGPAAFPSWFRFNREPRLGDGVLDPVALCLPADQLGPALGAKLGPAGPDDPPFFTLTLEMGLQVFGEWTTPWVLQHTRAPQAGDGYAASLVELWSEEGDLIALADQRARLRTYDPEGGFFERG